MSTYEILTLGIRALSFIALIIGFVVAVRQLKTNQKQYFDYHEWNRRLASFQIAEARKELISERRILDTGFQYLSNNDPIPLDKIISETKNRPEVRVAIHDLLNYYERIATGLAHCIYDQKIISTIFKSPILITYKQFNPYIEHYRDSFQPDAWECLTRLVQRYRADEDTKTVDRGATGTQS